MKIYIAGKITDCPNYKELFKNAEDKLITEGNACMNPSVLGEGFEWGEYMGICFKMLDVCDKIYMLKNWNNSQGARAEMSYAKRRGMEVLYE